MKLRDLRESTNITVGSYYAATDWEQHFPLTTVLVTFAGADEDTGETVVRFEYIKDGELEEYEWYADNFEDRSRPATEEEIAKFKADRRKIDVKFLNDLKNKE